jgi:hypothetical protein
MPFAASRLCEDAMKKTRLEKPFGERAYAEPVHAVEALDPAIQAEVVKHLQSEEQILQIISIPPMRAPEIVQNTWGRINYMHPVKISPRTYLISTQQRLLVIVQPEPGSAPHSTLIHVSEILSLELGVILLFAWAAVRWNNRGQIETTRFYFNSVRDELFKQILRRLSRAEIERANLPPCPEQRSLEALQKLPFKFKNILRSSHLFPDEGIRGVAFSPAVFQNRMIIFRKMLEPNLALIRTNYHVLVMHEELGNNARYGAVYHYYPLSSVVHASVQQIEGAVQLDLFLCKHGVEETLHFSFPAEEEKNLCRTFAEWIRPTRRV